MAFTEQTKQTLNNGSFNEQRTENGALAYATTGRALLDINFAVSTLRTKSDSEIIDQFIKVFYEDKVLAIKWLMFASDVREGLGERRLLRTVLTFLAKNHTDIAIAIVPVVAHFSRWDNLWCMIDTPASDAVFELVKNQLALDIKAMKEDKPASLLAKWMPSENTSSQDTVKLARKFISKLGMTSKQYRKILSSLRAYLNVIEVKMSNGDWDKIDYSNVPSKANLIYRNAFFAHDEERRREFLESLEKGETTINAGVLQPHEIVNKYDIAPVRWCCEPKEVKEDASLEALWANLKDVVDGNASTLCVADGSGSMTCTLPGTNATALDVANALAIYFAERATGDFHNKYFTFSENPQLVDLSNAKSLKEKLEIAVTHSEVANTDIEKVFDLILATAITGKMTQDELPKNLLILSDMEFDQCVTATGKTNSWGGRQFVKPEPKLFETFAKRFEEHGYKLPRLVFWNINSRSGAIPVKENELGCALVSGFSVNTMKMVMSEKLDPLECLLDQLNSPRYRAIDTLLKDLV